MAKSFLVLMLVATQLLAGSGGSLYLCVSKDGSCWCIDDGSDTCACCRDDDDGSDGRAANCNCNCNCDCDEVGCECHDRRATSPGESTIDVASDDCGCVHIPLLISVDVPTRVVRAAAPSDAARLALQIASLPLIEVEPAFCSLSASSARCAPPQIPDLALTTVSTVVIRC